MTNRYEMRQRKHGTKTVDFTDVSNFSAKIALMDNFTKSSTTFLLEKLCIFQHTRIKKLVKKADFEKNAKIWQQIFLFIFMHSGAFRNTILC